MVGRMDDDGVSRVCHFLNGCCQEEKAADENHVFQSKETGTYFCFKDIVCHICNRKSLFQRIIPKALCNKPHFIVT